MSCARILVVDDDPSLREAVCDTLNMAGLDTLECADGEAALGALNSSDDIALVLSDMNMSPLDGIGLLRRLRAGNVELPFVLMSAYGTISHAVDALRHGASDFIEKPFDAGALVEKVRGLLRSEVETAGVAEQPVARSASTRELLRLAARVAATDATVMISGESGTGKEVLARYLHANSDRAQQPFVAINCAAIPENMLEAVLFGYEKGAFTGAQKSMPGKFEQAQGGTLLLDEISEMDLGLQAKILRVLQEREVERLGGRRVLQLDVRVLATSNRNLREEVAAGRFREDLFYRLNVFPLHLPPLRERREDIVPLAESLLTRHERGQTPSRLSESAMAKMRDYAWPGNVRELDNVLQRARILANGSEIRAEDLALEVSQGLVATPAAALAPGLGDDLKQHENEKILEALEASNGSRKHAAQRLGISPRTLRYKLSRMRDDGVTVPGGIGA